MRIGIIVATEKEAVPFIEVFGDPTYSQFGFGYDVRMWNDIGEHIVCLIRSGYGEIAAASATQYLISEFHVNRIINYGVVGGLRKGLFAKKVGIVQEIVYYGFDSSGSGKCPVIKPKNNALPLWAIEKALGRRKLPEFICASADKFVMGGQPKHELRKQYKADICDMESAGIVITCNRNDIPCDFIKAISDGVEEDEDAFDENVYSASKICAEILFKIIKVL